jgi:hypothetical protein
MRSLALALALTFAANAHAQDPVDTAPVKADEGRALGDTGKLGVALLGGGAAAAASTGAATVLLEALSRDDSNVDGPPKNPEVVQFTGFLVVGLMSVSAGVMLLGGALLADDLAD